MGRLFLWVARYGTCLTIPLVSMRWPVSWQATPGQETLDVASIQEYDPILGRVWPCKR